MLMAIKLLHTVIWAALAGCIVALPVLALRKRWRTAVVVSGIVWVECAIIGLNAGRCPLTDWAARFTADRADNFDIYLPLWLARYNKAIFGVLFAMGEVAVVMRWWRSQNEPQGLKPRS